MRRGNVGIGDEERAEREAEEEQRERGDMAGAPYGSQATSRRRATCLTRGADVTVCIGIDTAYLFCYTLLVIAARDHVS